MYNMRVIEDENGRELMVINDKKEVAVARYPDLDEEMKEQIICIYKAITDGQGKDIRGFLNYENEDFCS